MVSFLILTLGISLCGMLGLLLIKNYELNTGRLFLAGARPVVGGFFERLSRLLNRILPGLAREYVRRGLRALVVRTQQAVARSVVYIEHVLEGVLETVRERTETLPHGEPSAFLRQVADHKKSLLKKSRPRATLRE